MIDRQHVTRRIFALTAVWIGAFVTLNLIRYWFASNHDQLQALKLFTVADAMIASAPVVIWMLVVLDWEKLKVGPLAFERQMRRRITGELSSENFQPISLEKLEETNAARIASSETNAVRVEVGNPSQHALYDGLSYFVEGNVDWKHVQYVFFTDPQGTLVGTMGPARFRNRLIYGGHEFRDALRNNDTSSFLEHGDEIHVKKTDSKSQVLQKFSEHQLQWFPVVNASGAPIGVIEPGRLAVSVLCDIAESLSAS